MKTPGTGDLKRPAGHVSVPTPGALDGLPAALPRPGAAPPEAQRLGLQRCPGYNGWPLAAERHAVEEGEV